jgi:hypothetical protein
VRSWIEESPFETGVSTPHAQSIVDRIAPTVAARNRSAIPSGSRHDRGDGPRATGE